MPRAGAPAGTAVAAAAGAKAVEVVAAGGAAAGTATAAGAEGTAGLSARASTTDAETAGELECEWGHMRHRTGHGT